MKQSKYTLPIALTFGIGMLLWEGGIWRILGFVSIGVGLFAGLATWLFERADKSATPD